jgi:hypothetical protein
MLSSLITTLVLTLTTPGGFDLNSATLDELSRLDGLTGSQAEALHRYIFETGGLRNIYQVMEIPGFTAEDLSWLREHSIVIPPDEGEIPPRVMDIMERLAEEDGPGDAAVEEWEDLLIRPIPVNSSSMWDIRALDRVSLIDAAAVEHRLRTIGPVSSVTSLRSTDNLSYYGYRNLRDFVSVRDFDLTSMELFGSYRLVVDGGDGRTDDAESLSGVLDGLESAIHEMQTGDRDYTGSPIDSTVLYDQLVAEYEEALAAMDITGCSHRVRTSLGDRFRGGVRLSRARNSTAGHGLFTDLDLGELSGTFDNAKAFVSLSHMGAFEQVVLGNYRLALGQGLLIDNTDEFIYRNTYRSWGLYPDLTSTKQFSMLGGATEIRTGPVLTYGFYSSTWHDAIVNQDGTINTPMMAIVRTSSYANVLQETTFGAYTFLDLGGILPTGTAIGLGAMSISWGDSLFPDHAWLDIPDDSYVWNCPEYEALEKGDGMNILALSGQTVAGNVSLEGEVARQDNSAMAGLVSARWQNDWFYLLGSWRHYDIGYTNPYNRGFAEQTRYDDTVFEYPYRLNDPVTSQLEFWPSPKPEEGVYIETRFQVSRQVTFTKVYLDVWRSLPFDYANHRFQGEVEYRPDWPVRFRLKYKYQEKTKYKDVTPTTSVTQEVTLRTLFLPWNSDFFDIQFRLGMVDLTPNPYYGDDRLMTGGYLSARWEHNFSDALSVLGGTTLWTTSGMSQWEFEDTGIDFLDGKGTKFYITVKNTLSDYLQLRFRILRKDTFFPRTGMYRPDPDDQFYYQGDPDSQVRDFGDHIAEYGIRCQLDFRW